MASNVTKLSPVVLEGAAVRLEPLTQQHWRGLCDVGLDADLWRWMPNAVRSEDEMRRYIDGALEQQNAGTQLPFAIIDRCAGTVIGSTRYGNIDLANQRVEIGWTWLAKPWQRTAINTEAKYLLLRNAFETIGCVRVELKTDALNEKSRKAILRIGAKEEGTLRRHIKTDTGRIRDTVYYSILDSEWPKAKAALEAKLARQSAERSPQPESGSKEPSTTVSPISIQNAEHYFWGQQCEGWHLVKRDDVSVIQERVPPGKTETKHRHRVSRQFFYVLEGEATLEINGESFRLTQHQGLEVPPMAYHQFKNNSAKDVHFLVISVPKSHGDREEYF